MKRLILVSALALAAPVHAEDVCRGHLVTIEPDGTVSAGSMDALRAAVRAGQPLRLGWHVGGPSEERRGVSHWADAGFVSEFGGEVFAQLVDIQKQVPQRDETRIALAPGRWTGLLGTTGALEGHFDSGEAMPPAKVGSVWCLDSRACPAPSWRLVYQHDADGKQVAGAKDALFDAVRRGRPIRFAWGMKAERKEQAVSVEHSAEPVFVTIANGGELFAQLPEHIAQASYADPGQSRFDRPGVMWRGLLGTDGSFDAVFVDRGTGSEVQRLPQRAAVAWFALAPEPMCEEGVPVTLAVPGGVRRR
jgi:hypothetical protein